MIKINIAVLYLTLVSRLHVRFDIFRTHGNNLHERIMSLSLSPSSLATFFMCVFQARKMRGHVLYLCVSGIDFGAFYDFGIDPMVWYFLFYIFILSLSVSINYK